MEPPDWHLALRSSRTPLWVWERVVLGISREASRMELLEGDRLAVLDTTPQTLLYVTEELRTGCGLMQMGSGLW